MKKGRKYKFIFGTLGYTLAILAWFSYSSLAGLDMLAYTKTAKSLDKSPGSHYSSLHHK